MHPIGAPYQPMVCCSNEIILQKQTKHVGLVQSTYIIIDISSKRNLYVQAMM
jgi:hypothetical protein